MEIVLFTNFFPYKKAEPFLVNEFEFTRKKSSKVSVFTLYGKKKDIQVEPSDNTFFLDPVIDSFLNKKSILLKGIFNFSPFSFHVKEFFSKRVFFSATKVYWYFISLFICRAALSSQAYKDLLEQLKKQETTVLYFYWGDNLCWIIPYIKKNRLSKKCKIVLRLHGSDLYEESRSGYAPLRDEIFSKCDLIVTVSENGKNYLSKKYPAYKNKIKTHRLGVFDNGLNPHATTDTFHIISVSNLVPLKRVDLIFRSLQETSANITWHHFGDGTLMPDLRELVSKARAGLTVNLHGFVGNDELISFYKTQSIDLFLNMSTSEGLPVSIMEALSFGIPVIATNVGGTSELVDSNVGSLIDPDVDPIQLGNAINSFLSRGEAELQKIRLNTRKTFHSKVSAIENYQAFYLELEKLFPR